MRLAQRRREAKAFTEGYAPGVQIGKRGRERAVGEGELGPFRRIGESRQVRTEIRVAMAEW